MSVSRFGLGFILFLVCLVAAGIILLFSTIQANSSNQSATAESATKAAMLRISHNSTSMATTATAVFVQSQTEQAQAFYATGTELKNASRQMDMTAQSAASTVSFNLTTTVTSTSTHTTTPTLTVTRTPSLTPTVTLTPDGLTRSRPVEFRSWTPPSSDYTLDVPMFIYRFRVVGFDAHANTEVIAKQRGNDEPPAGMKYVVATVEIECLSDSNSRCEFYGFEFYAVGSKGIVYEPPNLGYMISEQVFGGTILREDIAYLVSESDRDFVIFYDSGSNPIAYSAAYRLPFVPTPRPTQTPVTPEPTVDISTCPSGVCG